MSYSTPPSPDPWWGHHQHPAGSGQPFGQTGGWQALPAPPGGAPIATIGDMTVTQTEVITPGGSFPLAGSMWSINDMSHTEQRMPAWALVVALVGFLVVCVFSLFFLLVKETVVTGGVQVSVRQGPHFHTVMVPVRSQVQLQHIHQQLAYIRSVASA